MYTVYRICEGKYFFICHYTRMSVCLCVPQKSFLSMSAVASSLERSNVFVLVHGAISYNFNISSTLHALMPVMNIMWETLRAERWFNPLTLDTAWTRFINKTHFHLTRYIKPHIIPLLGTLIIGHYRYDLQFKTTWGCRITSVGEKMSHRSSTNDLIC